MTYSELFTLIQNFTDNNESTFNTTIPDFVKNAEDRIFNLVQSDFFRKNQSGNLTTGNRFLTCPTDFVLSFSLAVIDSSSDYKFLQKKHPSFMQEYAPDITDTSLRGLPLYYADFDKEYNTSVSAGTTIVVAPLPDADYSVELHYLYRPASLVSITAGTWLSQNARDALLYGSLVEAYTFMKGEPDLLNTYETRFQQDIARLKNRAEARGRRDEYRYDSLRSSVS
jgi:hypothetical protein|tara:strand:+ start:1877 stop:2551 length:675 start_codon:yes stop_codon:yes gene_type:complete